MIQTAKKINANVKYGQDGIIWIERMMKDPNLTIATFRPGECSKWLKVMLVSLIKSSPLKDGMIQTEKKIIANIKFRQDRIIWIELKEWWRILTWPLELFHRGIVQDGIRSIYSPKSNRPVERWYNSNRKRKCKYIIRTGWNNLNWKNEA